MTLILAVLVAGSLILAGNAVADDAVRGHIRRDGTIVQPHMRSDANQHRFDNYSSSGNSNPYTGQRGHDRNEFTNPPAYNTGRQQQPTYSDPVYSNPYRNPYEPQRSRR